jgi:hypothetical protein
VRLPKVAVGILRKECAIAGRRVGDRQYSTPPSGGQRADPVRRHKTRFNPAPISPTNASLLAPTCACGVQPLKKVDVPKDKDSPKRVDSKPPKRPRQPDDDVVVSRRPPAGRVRSGPSIGIGIGVGGGGFGGRGGGGYQGGHRY